MNISKWVHNLDSDWIELRSISVGKLKRMLDHPDKPIDKDSLNARFFHHFMRNQKQFHAYILMMVHNYQDAEDLMQEAAILMLEKFPEFQPDKPFFAWGMGITRNIILRFRHKRGRQTVFFQEKIYQQLEASSQQHTHLLDEKSDVMRACLRKLKERDRRLVAMRYEKQDSMKYIADQMNRSLDGLYHSFSRIYTALRQCVNRQMDLRERHV
jgi:RNA polymerase sigma-70 factor, ECF subfamily